MQKFLLKNYKTYIVVVIAIVLNGLVSLGYIDASWIDTANVILAFVGLGTIRLAIGKK